MLSTLSKSNRLVDHSRLMAGVKEKSMPEKQLPAFAVIILHFICSFCNLVSLLSQYVQGIVVTV